MVEGVSSLRKMMKAFMHFFLYLLCFSLGGKGGNKCSTLPQHPLDAYIRIRFDLDGSLIYTFKAVCCDFQKAKLHEELTIPLAEYQGKTMPMDLSKNNTYCCHDFQAASFAVEKGMALHEHAAKCLTTRHSILTPPSQQQYCLVGA